MSTDDQDYWANPTHPLDVGYFTKDLILLRGERQAITHHAHYSRRCISAVLDMGSRYPETALSEHLSGRTPLYICWDKYIHDDSEEYIQREDELESSILLVRRRVDLTEEPETLAERIIDSLGDHAHAIILLKRLLCNLPEHCQEHIVAAVDEAASHRIQHNQFTTVMISDVDRSIYRKMQTRQGQGLYTHAQSNVHTDLHAYLAPRGYRSTAIYSKYVFFTRVLYPQMTGRFLDYEDPFREDILNFFSVLNKRGESSLDELNPYRLWVKRA